MMGNIYIVTLIVAFVYLLIICSSYRKYISAFYVLLFADNLVMNIALLQVSRASNLESALNGYQFVYLVACTFCFLLMQCIADQCEHRIPKWLNFTFLSIATFIFIGATMGETRLFYQSIDLMTEDGFSYLVRVHGPLYIISPMILLAQLIYSLYIIGKAFRKEQVVARITCIWNLIIMLITVGVYIIERVVGTKMEWAVVADAICLGIMLLQLDREKRYDITSCAADYQETSGEYGFVLLDKDGRFEGADSFARRVFPELNELPIDRFIADASTPFLAQLNEWVKQDPDGSHREFQQADVFIEVVHTKMNHGRSGRVHCIRLRDNTDEKNYQLLMENYNHTLEKEVESKTERIQQVQDDIIYGMASIIDNRDSNTGRHVQRASETMELFVNYLQSVNFCDMLTPEYAENIIKGSKLHDFGKVAIPDEVLNKPGKFTLSEYEIMKEHSHKGAEMISQLLRNSENVYFRTIAVNMANYHHERWDGKGYPDGLKKKEIPLEARIMSLADVFDALVSKRVYKEQYSFDKAFSIIEEGAGTQFDPELCERFLECREKLEELYREKV